MLWRIQAIRPLFLRTNKKRVTARKEEEEEEEEQQEEKEKKRKQSIRHTGKANRSIRGVANQNAYYVAGRPAN